MVFVSSLKTIIYFYLFFSEGKNAPYESLIDTSTADNHGGEEKSVILYLAGQGADVNARDKYGLTPLHYAGMRGNDDAALDLLQLSNTNLEVRLLIRLFLIRMSLV